MLEEQKKLVATMQMQLYDLQCQVKNMTRELKAEDDKLVSMCMEESGHEFEKKDSGDCHSTRYYKVCKNCGYYK